MSSKFEKVGKLGPKGSMDGIFWGGPAECAGRAEALEFGKICSPIQHAVPRRGGGGLKREARTPPGHISLILSFDFLQGQKASGT